VTLFPGLFFRPVPIKLFVALQIVHTLPGLHYCCPVFESALVSSNDIHAYMCRIACNALSFVIAHRFAGEVARDNLFEHYRRTIDDYSGRCLLDWEPAEGTPTDVTIYTATPRIEGEGRWYSLRNYPFDNGDSDSEATSPANSDGPPDAMSQ
jgi:hypothetical protein